MTDLGDAPEDRLYEAGCDDATLWSRDGVVGLDFAREAGSLGEAVGSAVAAVVQAGCKPARIEIEEPAAA